MSAGGESGARGPLPDPDFSLHGLTISPEKPARPVEPLPEPAGGFTFVRELGRGGMGVVYEAVEDATGRRVALKIIAERLGESSRAVERFEREARLAASIAHPNCVFVYGAHVVHGATAISMELMTGQTLDDRIKSGEPVPVETAVQWGIEILEGLAAAHAVGIIHRDVKPSNCFLTVDGHVKVGDFGLSRSIDSDLGLTQSGSFVGSPLYASPEQIRGRPVDQRADVYSAGATIYAVLAGRPPHGGSSIGDVLAQIVSEAPTPLNSVRHGLPRGLDGVVLRALAKDPAKRFADCAAFERALLPFMPGSLSPATLGLRIVAYIIDVIIISSLYQGVCALLFISGYRFTNADPNAAWIPTRGVWACLAPTLANVCWFSVGEGVFGTTVGKLMFGLRVVAIDGSRTPLWRAVVRAVVFFAPSTLPTFFWGLGTKPLQALYRLPSYLFPMITMRPSNAWRGFHEFASGTRVLRAQPRAMAAGLVTILDPPRPTAAGIPAAIGGYAVEGLVGPTSQGAVVVARDPELDRKVWIHLGGHRRPDSSPTRAMALRWLHHGEQPLFHDVYEYPGGAGLHEYAAAPPAAIPWTAARVLLADLAEDLAERSGDLALSQIWIDRSGRLRVLDFAIGDPAADPPRPVAETFTAAARILLSTPASDGPRVPTDVPVHAEAAVKRLVGGAPPFASVEEARVELRAIASRLAVVTRRRRLAQVGLAGLWLVYIGLIMVIASHTVLTPEFRDKLGPVKVERATGGIAAFMILAAIVIPSLILAFALRGGLTFTLLGVRVRNRKGRLASRFRCVLRSAVTCLPVVPVLAAALAQLFGGPAWILAGGIASAVVYLAGAAWSLRTPAEGIADRAARTSLVVK